MNNYIIITCMCTESQLQLPLSSLHAINTITIIFWYHDILLTQHTLVVQCLHELTNNISLRIDY